MRTLPTLSIFMALTLAGCTGRQDDPAAEVSDEAATHEASSEPVLETYAVPTGRSEEVMHVLKRAFSQGRDAPPRGTVNRLEDGRLVVVAPASVHAGVAGLCEDLEEVGPAPTPPTIEISYWLVVAEPGGSEVAATMPNVLRPALEEITAQDGPAAFSLLESQRITSLASTGGETRGSHAEIKQRATVVDGEIIADIEINGDRGSRLDSRLSLQPGELVIIGHAGHQIQGDANTRLYYVVRAQIA